MYQLCFLRIIALFWIAFFCPSLFGQTTLPTFYGSYPPVPVAGQWQSAKVFYNSSGQLTYATDSQNNRIPDYSYAGYHSGEASIPVVPEVSRLSPTTGDQTARIQQALDQVGARAPDANGIRGALVLSAGTYEIRGTLRINKSGVALRGVGDGSSSASNTILRATGNTPVGRSVILVGSGSGSWGESSTKTDITTSVVRVNAMSFTVASTSGFAIGNNILIRHDSTEAWIDAIGGGGATNEWNPAAALDILYKRRIAAISGNTITIDAPIFDHLVRADSQSRMVKLNWAPVTESGIENLRVDIVTAGGEDENHASNAITMEGAENCWVRNATTLHFIYAGVEVTHASRCTVEDVNAVDPVAVRTGGNMYNLVADGGGQLTLFKDCFIANGRHGCSVNGGAASSGNVFQRITCGGSESQDLEGGHRHWSQATLYDNCTVQSGSTASVRLINRGDAGASHGWAVVHGTSWRFNRGSSVQKPPPAQNYGISDIGSPGGDGWVEKKTGTLIPQSLYEAQLCDRIAKRSFFLVARHSGKVLQVLGASTTDGAAIVQAAPAAGTHDQWSLMGIGGGFCKIIAGHSSKAMVVQSASTSDGAGIVQFPYSSAAPSNDEWKIEAVTGGYYRLVNRNSGKVVGIVGGSIADGAAVQQMTWTGATNQQFRIQDAGSAIAPPDDLAWEAEELTRTSGGAVTTVQTDTAASAGQWISLDAVGSGDFVEYTLPNVPPGTYDVVLAYKEHPNRGMLKMTINGVLVGDNLDQYAPDPQYVDATFGPVVINAAGNQALRLTVVDKNPAAGTFSLSADKFTLVPSTGGVAPVITSSPVTTAIAGSPYSYDVNANGTPTPTYSLVTAPPGMTINSTSGVISWTPTAPGTVNVTVRASNGVSPNADQSYAITVNSAPSITSTAVTSGTVGVAYSYDVNATGQPAPTYSLSSAPSDMTIDSTSGVISWTPTSAGSFPVTINASNGVNPNASQSFTIDVAPASGDYVREAESASPVGTGATIQVTADSLASGGQWVSLLADGAGDFVQYTLPNVQAGTYSVKMRYKTNNNRGIAQMSIGGTNVGAAVDQFSSPSGYVEATFGNYSVAATGNVIIRLSVTGQNASSTGLTVSADRFTLSPVPGQNGGIFEAENLTVEGSSGDVVRLLSETAASGGATVMNDTDAVGDFVTFRIPSIAAGTYTVKVRFKLHPSRGITQVMIGKIGGALGNLGIPVDLYSTASQYQEFTIGNWTPASTSDKQISFKITGKNASSSGFTQNIDSIMLVPQ
jgi:hypothetical protein